MKINRHFTSERYNTTVDWLNDFSKELEKQAYNLDYLKDLFDKRRQFSSIDEKMADIKKRIGFELVMKVSKELGDLDDVKSQMSSDNEVKVAAYQHPEENIKKMNNILSYINDMVEHEGHLDSALVVNRCRDEENLGFNDLNIDLKKLIEHIESLLGQKKESDIDDDVKYIPNEAVPSDEAADNVADYYNHAEPQSV